MVAALVVVALGALGCAWVAMHLDGELPAAARDRAEPRQPRTRAGRHVLVRVLRSRPAAVVELVLLVAFVATAIAGTVLGLADLALNALRHVTGG